MLDTETSLHSKAVKADTCHQLLNGHGEYLLHDEWAVVDDTVCVYVSLGIRLVCHGGSQQALSDDVTVA